MSAPATDATAALAHHPGLAADDGEAAGFDWRGALGRLWPRRRWLAGCAAAGGLAALLLAFLLPPVYVASVSLMEAQDQASDGLAAQLGAVEEQLALPLASHGGGVSTYPEIVRSRRLLARVLAQSFPTSRGRSVSLLEHLTRPAPPAQRLDRGVRRLRGRLDVALDRRVGILTLRVRMDDPVLAAGVATAVCATLQDIVMHSMTTQAGANRRFVEGRVADARRDLAAAEDALRAFRESNLRGSSPRVVTEEARLLRETRLQEEVVLTLTRQEEIARVEEQKDVPVLNVLDPAVPPAFRSWPRRGLLTVLGLVLGLTGGVAWVLRPPALRREAPAR